MPLDLRPMHDAPRDGMPILIRFEHENYKYAIGADKERWEELCIAMWIEFNGGGWTWHGICGRATGWKPLVTGVFADIETAGFYTLKVPEYA
jgi:hypothetical protein